MFPAKHQKIVKGRAKKKPSKLCSTYSHHHRRLGESWRDRVFFCHPCLANVHCFIVGLDSMYALCTTGLGAPWWRDPNFTYAPSPSSCRWKAALNGFFSRPLFFLGSNNAGEYWTVQHSCTVQWIFPPYENFIGRFKSVLNTSTIEQLKDGKKVFLTQLVVFLTFNITKRRVSVWPSTNVTQELNFCKCYS